MSLFSIFAENSYSVCLAAQPWLVAPLFVRNLYKTAAGAGLASVQSMYRAS